MKKLVKIRKVLSLLVLFNILITVCTQAKNVTPKHTSKLFEKVEDYRTKFNARNIFQKDKVIATITRLLHAFNEFAEEQGASYSVGIFSSLKGQIGLASEAQKNFDRELNNATLVLAPMVWEESTAYGSSFRKEQLERFKRILPSRFDTWERCWERMSYVVSMIFPKQSDEFYNEFWREVSEKLNFNIPSRLIRD